MEASDLLKKVRKIEIKARGLSQQVFSGQYHSAFKGKGMAFSEVREYQYGDDIRSIDWNVTARLNHPYVKIFEEERELTVILIIDVSGSNDFGSGKMIKQEVIAELAAVLSFSAIHNNDKVGVIFFSDKIEKFIPPKKGTTHILRIIRELINFKAESQQTNISGALEFFTNVNKKRTTAFLISDFLDTDFEDAIKIASGRHDLIGIRTSDPREMNMPSSGLYRVIDPESGELSWLDTSYKAARSTVNKRWRGIQDKNTNIFRKYGLDVVDISTEKDYVKPIIQLFRERGARY